MNKRTYEIETGKYKKEMEATNLTLAVIRAFKKSPPKNASLLTRARFKYPQIGEKNKGDSVWHYLSTIYLLKKAGYKVK